MLNVNNASGLVTSRTFTINVSGIFIDHPAILPTAVVGTPYGYTLTATGASGTVLWSAPFVPPGLTLSPVGVLSGRSLVGGDAGVEGGSSISGDAQHLAQGAVWHRLVARAKERCELLALEYHFLFRKGGFPPESELRFVKAAEAPVFSDNVGVLQAFSGAVPPTLSVKKSKSFLVFLK